MDNLQIITLRMELEVYEVKDFFFLNNLVNPSIATTNKWGEIGSPCRKPLPALKYPTRLRLRAIMSLELVMHSLIQFTNRGGQLATRRHIS